MAGEFDLIARHFRRATTHTVLGVGDDAALMQPAPGQHLAVSSDMLVAGCHFLADTDPERLGHKALAVNLSDLAAMGATPRWVLLALALPHPDEDWVAAFARGFHAEACAHQVDWVGGDTTAGPLNISVTILGEVPVGHALRRSGALPGDQLWVSGTLGDAACGLACLQQRLGLDDQARAHCVARLERPTARVGLGLALRGVASAAIDVSDGLLADLGHLLTASGLGARVDWPAVPLSAALAGLRDDNFVRAAALTGGDDYELCFTAPASASLAVQAAAAAVGVRVTAIGVVESQDGTRVFDRAGRPMAFARAGFDHFADVAAPAVDPAAVRAPALVRGAMTADGAAGRDALP